VTRPLVDHAWSSTTSSRARPTNVQASDDSSVAPATSPIRARPMNAVISVAWDTRGMGVVRGRTETTCAVPGADVRLTATTLGVRVASRVGGGTVVNTGPRHVEVRRADGRVETARVCDLDRAARVLVVALGFVAARVVRARRSSR
jgi:hypothetical protein